MKKKYTLLYAQLCALEKKPLPNYSDLNQGINLNIIIFFKPKL